MKIIFIPKQIYKYYIIICWKDYHFSIICPCSFIQNQLSFVCWLFFNFILFHLCNCLSLHKTHTFCSSPCSLPNVFFFSKLFVYFYGLLRFFVSFLSRLSISTKLTAGIFIKTESTGQFRAILNVLIHKHGIFLHFIKFNFCQ